MYVKMKIFLKTYWDPIWEWRCVSGTYTLAPFRKGHASPRYYQEVIDFSQLYDDELYHIERIVNGFESESGALLYLDHESELVKKLAHVIVNEGRTEVLILYTHDKNLAHNPEHNERNPLRGYPHNIKELKVPV